MAEILKVIGLMSGTSLDGIDAAILETDGADFVAPGPALGVPYDAATRAILRAALADAPAAKRGAPMSAPIQDAERRLTQAHAEAVAALLRQARLSASDIALIGFHGQTILHRPEQRWTWQIGDGARLARLTGIDVVNDFRSADVHAGGQGAPIVPLYHRALVRQATALVPPAAIVNIGGVANVTFVAGETVLAFDTGPGNAPLDDWALRHTGRPVDQDGGLARQGRVDETRLSTMLRHEYLARVPPKSLDRFDFGIEAVDGLSAADGAATLTAFTAATVAGARDHFPAPASTWVVCGGGRHNRTLMDQLRRRIAAPVLGAEDLTWSGDFVEAQAVAYLAVRSLLGLPLSLPTTTGVAKPMRGGTLHRSR